MNTNRGKDAVSTDSTALQCLSLCGEFDCGLHRRLLLRRHLCLRMRVVTAEGMRVA